jgi:hypothetical protein
VCRVGELIFSIADCCPTALDTETLAWVPDLSGLGIVPAPASHCTSDRSSPAHSVHPSCCRSWPIHSSSTSPIELVLHNALALTDHGLHTLSSASLTSLTLSACENVTPAALQELSALHKLTSLS